MQCPLGKKVGSVRDFRTGKQSCGCVIIPGWKLILLQWGINCWINNNESFNSSTNIKHSLTSSIAYQLKQFQIALAWNWRTGKPYTKAYISPEIQYYYIGINTETLPNYHRLDFSTTYGFNFSKKSEIKGKVGFSIRNVYNQKNHLSREYVGNNSINDPIVVVDKYSLGITPNFLFRAYF